MAINFRVFLAGYKSGQMLRYLDLAEVSFNQHLSGIGKDYEEEMSRKISEEEYDSLNDQYTDKFIEAAHDFPQLLLCSFIVAWYSSMEQKLLEVCNELSVKLSIDEIKVSKDKGIRRAKKFLSEEVKYEIQSNHWQDLVEVSRLRNYLVHRGNKINGKYFRSSDKEIPLTSEIGNIFYFPMEISLLTYLQKNGLVYHSSSSLKIAPTFIYCRNLVKLGEELLLKLYSDLDIG